MWFDQAAWSFQNQIEQKFKYKLSKKVSLFVKLLKKMFVVGQTITTHSYNSVVSNSLRMCNFNI